VSGPITATDAAADTAEPGHPEGPTVQLVPSRPASVGGMDVRRALPRRQRRTVGPWCFADHFGPVAPDGPGGRMEVGPHPHTGLQTVTWQVEGEVVHTDSLGSEQPIRPGQLNLMTAGRGVAHAEQTPASYRGVLHGIQLWIAQPDTRRDQAPDFVHHAELPVAEYGSCRATVLIGDLGGVRSPSRFEMGVVGVELAAAGPAEVLPVEAELAIGSAAPPASGGSPPASRASRHRVPAGCRRPEPGSVPLNAVAWARVRIEGLRGAPARRATTPTSPVADRR
jgi:hypothetical protein